MREARTVESNPTTLPLGASEGRPSAIAAHAAPVICSVCLPSDCAERPDGIWLGLPSVQAHAIVVVCGRGASRATVVPDRHSTAADLAVPAWLRLDTRGQAFLVFDRAMITGPAERRCGTGQAHDTSERHHAQEEHVNVLAFAQSATHVWRWCIVDYNSQGLEEASATFAT